MTKISDFCAGRTPAALYEEYLVPGLFTPWAEEMVALARAGAHVLDLACGTGIVTRKLLERFGDNIEIGAIDVAPPMLDVARRAVGADNARLHLAPAHETPFDDDQFDFVFCQQGVQFFPDPSAAFAEISRILKPGGRFVASVWAPAETGCPVFASFAKAIEKHLGEDLLPLGPFAFGPIDRLRELANGASLNIETLESRTKPAELPSIETLVLFDVLFLGRPAPDGELAPAIDPADPAGDAVIEAIIAHMYDDLSDYIADNGSLNAPITAHFLTARK